MEDFTCTYLASLVEPQVQPVHQPIKPLLWLGWSDWKTTDRAKTRDKKPGQKDFSYPTLYL